MKTQTNHNRTGKLVMTLFLVTSFATGILAQPNPNAYNNSEVESIKRIEAYADQVMQSLKYVAPSVEKLEKYACCKEELLEWACKAVESMRYQAPSVEKLEAGSNVLAGADNPAFRDAITRLEALAASIENELRYLVPEEAPTFAFEYEKKHNRETETLDYLTLKNGSDE